MFGTSKRENRLEELVAEAVGCVCAAAVNREELKPAEQKFLKAALEEMPQLETVTTAMLLPMRRDG